MAVVTGPNASGKSVYLQQVGLIVYLAHIGCFVPAQHAEVGLTDRILTRMVCDDGHDALFAKDLVQLSGILRAATPRSLVLIDEFGKVGSLCRLTAIREVDLNTMMCMPCVLCVPMCLHACNTVGASAAQYA